MLFVSPQDPFIDGDEVLDMAMAQADFQGRPRSKQFQELKDLAEKRGVPDEVSSGLLKSVLVPGENCRMCGVAIDCAMWLMRLTCTPHPEQPYYKLNP